MAIFLANEHSLECTTSISKIFLKIAMIWEKIKSPKYFGPNPKGWVFFCFGVKFRVFKLLYIGKGAEFQKTVRPEILKPIKENNFAQHATIKSILGVIYSAKLSSLMSSTAVVRKVFGYSAIDLLHLGVFTRRKANIS